MATLLKQTVPRKKLLSDILSFHCPFVTVAGPFKAPKAADSWQLAVGECVLYMHGMCAS